MIDVFVSLFLLSGAVLVVHGLCATYCEFHNREDARGGDPGKRLNAPRRWFNG